MKTLLSVICIVLFCGTSISNIDSELRLSKSDFHLIRPNFKLIEPRTVEPEPELEEIVIFQNPPEPTPVIPAGWRKVDADNSIQFYPSEWYLDAKVLTEWRWVSYGYIETRERPPVVSYYTPVYKRY